jgi:uncharacterized DUF497 family protein
MNDWSRIEGFEWDTGNEHKSADKHGVTRLEAEQLFFKRPLLVVADSKHSIGEPRFHALGHSDAGRFLQATFTLRSDNPRLRVISVRQMSRKERLYYEQHP